MPGQVVQTCAVSARAKEHDRVYRSSADPLSDEWYSIPSGVRAITRRFARREGRW
jgi:hypothetical protein